MFRKKKIINQIEKLDLKQGDVIVLRTDKGYAKWVIFMRALMERIQETKKISITALVLPNDVRFGSIGENEMNNAGWFKQDPQEILRILEENKTLHEWNDNIKKQYIDDALKAHNIQIELKRRLKKYEK